MWTDLRNRTKHKISKNSSSGRKTGAGPFEGTPLSSTEMAVDAIVFSSVAANPSGREYGVPSTGVKKLPLTTLTNAAKKPSPTKLPATTVPPAETNSIPRNIILAAPCNGETSPVIQTESNSVETGDYEVLFEEYDQPSSAKKRKKDQSKCDPSKVTQLMSEQNEAIKKHTEVLEKLLNHLNDEKQVFKSMTEVLTDISDILHQL